MPRLLHVTTTDISLELLLGPQLRAFRDAGFEVHTASAPGPFVADLEADGIVHHPLRHATRASAPHKDVLALGELYRLFRRLRPDVVHTHNPKPGVYGRIAARLARVPLVVNTQHGLYAQPTDRLARRVPVYVLERIAAAFSHVELVQNEEDIVTLRRLRVPAAKLHLLGNGVDLDRFRPRPEVRTEVRAELDIGDDQIVVGAVGRLVWEKGYAELFEAAKAILAERDDVLFVIAGPTDPDKGDPLTADDIAAAEVGRRSVPRPPRRPRAAVPGLRRVCPGQPPGGLPPLGDGGGRHRPAHRGLRHPRVPAGGRPRRHRSAGHRPLPRRAPGPHRRSSSTTPTCGPAMSAEALDKARRDFDQQRVIDRTLAVYPRP